MAFARVVRSLAYPPSGLSPCWTLAPKHEIDLPEAIRAVLPDQGTPGYPISRALASLLACLVLAGRRSVLEIGAGSSSVVLAQSLSYLGGGKLTSVEQWPEWCREAWARVLSTPGVDAHLEVSVPKLRFLPSGPCHFYSSAMAAVRRRGPYDLVLVDAPQWYCGRDGALPLVLDALSPGALIVVDDAGRHQEQWAIRRWRYTYPGLALLGYDPSFGKNGVAVLGFNGKTSRRYAVGTWLSSAVHAVVGWAARRARDTKP